jgi:hypothetical protein
MCMLHLLCAPTMMAPLAAAASPVAPADPCTFRIVLKNATDLEPAAVQDAAREKMELLVLAYQKLDDYLEMAREGSGDAVPKAREQLKATQLIAADIEAFVKQTLGV